MKTLLTPTPLIAIEHDRDNIITTASIEVEGEGCFEYEVIGTFDKGKIDFDTSSFVKSIPNKVYQYYDYGKSGFLFINPNTSFASLLHSHSLSLDKKYLIIKSK